MYNLHMSYYWKNGRCNTEQDFCKTVWKTLQMALSRHDLTHIPSHYYIKD